MVSNKPEPAAVSALDGDPATDDGVLEVVVVGPAEQRGGGTVHAATPAVDADVAADRGAVDDHRPCSPRVEAATDRVGRGDLTADEGRAADACDRIVADHDVVADLERPRRHCVEHTVSCDRDVAAYGHGTPACQRADTGDRERLIRPGANRATVTGDVPECRRGRARSATR